MYKTYSTEYKILFKNRLISKNSYQSIPKSTRNEWKYKNFDNIYGVKEIEDLIFYYKTVKENRIAKSTLYGLCKIIIIYKQMLNNTLHIEKRVIIYTDGGSENRSVTEVFISNKKNLEHRICQKNWHGSNSMIEAIIKKIKQCFIYPGSYSDFDDFSSKLEKAITIYSQQTTLDALGGKTPNEAFYNIEPFQTEVATLIKTAAIKRYKINRYSDCF